MACPSTSSRRWHRGLCDSLLQSLCLREIQQTKTPGSRACFKVYGMEEMLVVRCLPIRCCSRGKKGIAWDDMHRTKKRPSAWHGSKIDQHYLPVTSLSRGSNQQLTRYAPCIIIAVVQAGGRLGTDRHKFIRLALSMPPWLVPTIDEGCRGGK
ncbi:hypothetical protein BO94DRAFT_352162 [Aspergillus sclerotioniger CBS 115572]|uniref:Uncharacterized protein n=1 Tax=Aspergillus sclerotioniger CBS 115572 TaxID=1450535 RepID=A0A317X806_9EURO|nr:hypothetical protein BO94DRAFT_352162 [Aspergillus sclerotioniger CBS 115572]PWY93772.1 hypothetical protein BO94DRAFT_352162 [Aspergillus sclerotioniger CBS 115572]